jgi:hypothetical protein
VNSSLTERDLRMLRGKYERMLRLRALHARARADPTYDEPDPRREMASLANEFPGALRELDILPIDVLHARIDALDAAGRDPQCIEDWMRAQLVFHRFARGALAAKRWLVRMEVTDATRAAFLTALPALAWSEDAALLVDDLAAVAHPPRGRLMDVVYELTAKELGVSRREVMLLVKPRR